MMLCVVNVAVLFTTRCCGVYIACRKNKHCCLSMGVVNKKNVLYSTLTTIFSIFKAVSNA